MARVPGVVQTRFRSFGNCRNSRDGDGADTGPALLRDRQRTYRQDPSVTASIKALAGRYTTKWVLPKRAAGPDRKLKPN